MAWQATDRSRAAAARAADTAGDGRLRASMNGRVVALLAAPGDAVRAGQPLLTLEAMKMEHVHLAPCAGRLAALHVSLGEQVASQRVLAEIEVPAAPQRSA
jgi:geranyl-CoA carboxylase alpha subunit